MNNINSLTRVESNENRIIKLVKSLNQKKYRDREGLFYVEGVKFVMEAIASSWEVRAILISDSFAYSLGVKAYDSCDVRLGSYDGRLGSYDGKLGSYDVRLGSYDGRLGEITTQSSQNYILPDKLYAGISDTESPQGIMAVVKQEHLSLDRTFGGANLFLILDGIQDPGNMGTIIRTADSAAFNAIILSKGCVDIYNPKVVRSTAGSLFHIPCVHSTDLADTMALLRTKGIKTYSAVMSAKHTCFDSKLDEKAAIAIGNEANGISPEVLKNSDDTVSIPILGKAESLNASVAAGILIYETVSQRLNR